MTVTMDNRDGLTFGHISDIVRFIGPNRWLPHVAFTGYAGRKVRTPESHVALTGYA